MAPLVSAYVLGELVATLLTGGFVLHLWRYRSMAGFKWLIIGITAAFVHFTLRLVHVLSPDTYVKEAMVVAPMVLGPVGVVSLLLFALEYTDFGRWVNAATVTALAIVPVSTWSLYFGDVRPDLIVEGFVQVNESGLLAAEFGPLIYVHAGYQILLLGTTIVLLVRHFSLSNAHYWRQLGVLVGFLLVMVTMFVITIAFPTIAVVALDLMLAVGIISLWFGVLKYDIADVKPVARKTVFEGIRDAVVVLDEDDLVVDVNPMALEVLDAAEDEIIGEPVGRFLPVDDVGRGLNKLTIDVGDETRHFDVTRSPIRSNGQEIGTALLLYDVTELREREEQLKSQNERLDRFTGVVSHDLRSPMMVAMSYTGLLTDRLDGEEREYAETARESLERMEAIIDDALTFAKEDERDGDFEPVDLGTVVHQAWGNVETDAAELEIDLDARVISDRSQLLRVFENLFRNAVEHGIECEESDASVGGEPANQRLQHLATDAEGDPEVRIRIGTTENGFFVEDDGPGIPSEIRDQVFEMGVTTSEDGTGFGLAIVDRIAGAHGWDVTVTESSDGGARFEFDGVEPADKYHVTDESAGSSSDSKT